MAANPLGADEAEYRLETALKTLRVSRVMAAVMIPVFLYMIVTDILLGMPMMMLARLSALIPALILLPLSFRWLVARPRWVVPSHSVLLLGAMCNGTMLVFLGFHLPLQHTGDKYALMGGLVLIIFTVFVFAAGARRYVGAITVVPMLAMCAAFGIDDTLTSRDWSYLVNPAMAVVAVTVTAYLQEGMVRREFFARSLASQRLTELESAMAELTHVNRLLTEEIEVRKRLEARLEQQTGELRETNSRLQTEVQEHKLTATKMEHYLTELKRSNEDLRQFANVIAHDLIAPVRTVSCFVELLSVRLRALGVTDQEAEDCIGRSIKGAKLMGAMIESLLDYARVDSQSNPPQAVNLTTVLEEVQSMLSKEIESHHAKIEVQPLSTVRADPHLMIRLFANLIGNAIKYAHPSRQPVITIASRRENEWHHLSIQDNGMGFDPAQAEHIFDLFHRLDPRGPVEGMGMGLAICRKIVERMGGRIWAVSRADDGSTFHFTLPVG